MSTKQFDTYPEQPDAVVPDTLPPSIADRSIFCIPDCQLRLGCHGKCSVASEASLELRVVELERQAKEKDAELVLSQRAREEYYTRAAKAEAELAELKARVKP